MLKHSSQWFYASSVWMASETVFFICYFFWGFVFVFFFAFEVTCPPLLFFKQISWLCFSVDVVYEKSEVAQSCPTLSNPMDCSLPGSSFHGIFQARMLEWVAISFPRAPSWPKNRTQVSHTVGRFFTIWATHEKKVPIIFLLAGLCFPGTGRESTQQIAFVLSTALPRLCQADLLQFCTDPGGTALSPKTCFRYSAKLPGCSPKLLLCDTPWPPACTSQASQGNWIPGLLGDCPVHLSEEPADP